MSDNEAQPHKPNEIAHDWRDRLEIETTRFLNSEEQTRAGFLSLLWEQAILDHIAPLDQKEIAARKSKDRPVWDKGRESPELYWKILYSAAAAKEATQRNWTLAADSNSYIVGIFPPIYAAMEKRVIDKLYPKNGNESPNRIVTIIDDIITKAKSELEKRDQQTTGHPLKWESHGKWHGIDVIVERFSGSGEISFRAKNIEDHMKLYDMAPDTSGAAQPWEIDPSNFE